MRYRGAPTTTKSRAHPQALLLLFLISYHFADTKFKLLKFETLSRHILASRVAHFDCPATPQAYAIGAEMSEPCVEHVGVWATWDGTQGHLANVEISIRVKPAPNSRIPIVCGSDPNIKSISLRRTVRLENPAVRIRNHTKHYSGPTCGSEELSDFDAAEMRLIGSPIDDPPLSIRRHIFPKVAERYGFTERGECPNVLTGLDTSLFEGNTATQWAEKGTVEDIRLDTALKGKPSESSLEGTKIGDSRSLRDDVGPALSVVEDPTRSDRIRFVVLPDDKRFASGSTAEISLPSGPSSIVGEGELLCAGDEVNASTTGGSKRKSRSSGSKAESAAGEEPDGPKTVNRKNPDIKGCDPRTRSSCLKVGPLVEVRNPSSASPPELRAIHRKAASGSKKAPWKSPSQEDHAVASKTSSSKINSFRQSVKESRQSPCSQQGRGSRSTVASPRSTQSEKSPFSGRQSRAIGRSSGGVFNIFLDDSDTHELAPLQRKPRPQHPWSDEDPLVPTNRSSESRSDLTGICVTLEPKQTPSPLENLESTDRLRSHIGEDFELELLSPVKKEWARLVERPNEASPPIPCTLSASILRYDSDFSGSPDSTNSHILEPFTTVKGGVLFACFPEKCGPTTLQLEFEATIVVQNVGRNHWCCLEVLGLPWSEKSTSRAALIIGDGCGDAVFQFHTPTFDEKFLYGSNSSVIGKFNLREPLRVLFRKKQEVQRLDDFEMVVETYTRPAYDLLSGINSFYSITLCVCGPRGRELDIFADRVCIEFIIRNGPEDASAYSIKEKPFLQFIPGEKLDETGGRKAVIMCDAADVEHPITIDFSVNLGGFSQSVELPFIQPMVGEGLVMMETITMAEIPPPLRANFNSDGSHLDWLHTQHLASGAVPELHKFLRKLSLEIPDSGFLLNLFLLDDYHFHDICLNSDDHLAPISSIGVLIYEAPGPETVQCGQSLLECEMLVEYEIPKIRFSQELIGFAGNGWRSSHALVNGRVAERGQFYETPEGEVAFLLNNKFPPGDVVSLKLYWSTKPDSRHEGNDRSDQGSQLQYHKYDVPWVDERSVYRISVGCDIKGAVVTGRNGPEPRKLAFSEDPLGFPDQAAGISANSDSPPTSEDNRENEEIPTRPGGLFLENGEFLSNGGYALEEGDYESKPRDGLASSIGRVFCSIRGC
ncbi:hypothetical protein FGG08_001341 [Glutinoglossum americanum]|uniref:Uncharacterized protein n=1 Tax=Glutinoglossum americanum TaxID=1670608 RepID=A0A9P8I7A1_9PEZI|nr:hypothetical protein FGG08_001341 [Glutinoglossum americanum]